ARLATPIAPATAAESAATSAAATAAELRFRTRFVDRERAPAELRFVQLGDRLLRVGIGRHLDECEPARATCGGVPDDVHRINGARAAEQLAKLVFRYGIWKIPNIEFTTHGLLLPPEPRS